MRPTLRKMLRGDCRHGASFFRASSWSLTAALAEDVQARQDLATEVFTLSELIAGFAEAGHHARALALMTGITCDR